MAAGDAHRIALAFLDGVVASLNTIPDDEATLAGAPGRQYVATGTPAIDCEQVSVWLATTSELPLFPTSDGDLIAGQRGIAGRVNWVNATVIVARCVPTVQQQAKSGRTIWPTPDEMTAAAYQTNADMWAMWCGLNVARTSGLIAHACESVMFGVATALLTAGGFGGWQLPLMFQLGGYRPDVGGGSQ